MICLKGKTDDQQYSNVASELTEKNGDVLDKLKSKLSGRQLPGRHRFDFEDSFPISADQIPSMSQIGKGERCYGINQKTFDRLMKMVTETFTLIFDKLVIWFRNRLNSPK